MTTLTLSDSKIDNRIYETLCSYSTVASQFVTGDVVRLLDPTRMFNIIVRKGLSRRSIMELQGLGREVWQGVDPEKYINELRDEWKDH